MTQREKRGVEAAEAGVSEELAPGPNQSSEKPEEASSQHKGSKGAKGEPMSVSRRSLCIGVGSTAVLLGLGALRFVGHDPLCRPPGGQDESHLVSACIRCERCYEVCPRKVIVPAHIESGLLGMRTPTLDFTTDYCDFCTEENGGSPKCVEACPTEALVLPEGATAENTLIGLAVIDTWSCLAYRDTACRECYDACPYEAIVLSDAARNPLPSVVTERCNGCGACESVCLSLTAGSVASGATERAIIVRPLDAVS